MIETEAENDEALTVVESLLERGEAALKPEELALLDLLGTLIERFEQRAYALQEGDPTGALVILMEGRSLKPADLAEVLGSRASVSGILSRKRAIRKAQAKRLAEFFNVSPGMGVQVRTLRVRQRRCVPSQPLPQEVQQLELLC